MDLYTETTKSWLDERYRATDAQGVYIAHQPIYGFRKEPCEPCLVERYAITSQIMYALSHLKFQSLLDVGGSEGYKAALVREFFKADVHNYEISEEACKRSVEIFKVPATGGSIHSLPFPNDAFDVVLCSETLEHVPDFEAATKELLRVAKFAVVITVPKEPPEVVAKYIEEKTPHGHIHALNENSFDFTDSHGVKLKKVRGMNHNGLKIMRELVEARPRGYGKNKYPKIIYDLYSAACPMLRKVCGKSFVRRLINLDQRISERSDNNSGMCFTLLKYPVYWNETSKFKFSEISAKVLEFSVPYIYLRS